MKKKTMTGKETRQLIEAKVTEGVDTLKEETNKVMDKVKEAASDASRKGKAAVRAIKS